MSAHVNRVAPLDGRASHPPSPPDQAPCSSTRKAGWPES